MSGDAPQAVELHADHLRLRWPDAEFVLAASVLRAACRCAHCKAAALKGAVSSAEGPEVALRQAELVGHYALRLSFSDGHDRGIYPWSLLREMSASEAGDNR